MKQIIASAEKGLLPDGVIRWGIRRLDAMRLRVEARRGDPERQSRAKERLVETLRQGPVAVAPEKPNEQHYEVPAPFFQHVLGRRMKYSSCYWPSGVKSLDAAEEAMLALTCDRAQVADGMDLLDLGCGWGAFSLWAAHHYPNARILAVSNSKLQRDFIIQACEERGLGNVTVLSRDMNHFDTRRRFDRIVSVEMFEHMGNWDKLLGKIATWLKPEGKLFVHIFTHRRFCYLFEVEGHHNWLGRHFFTGGVMPSDDLLLYFQNRVLLERHWTMSGRHYQKTAEAWLQKMDVNRKSILALFKEVYGPDAPLWVQRWRIFFMACAELWGFKGGREWLVSHYRFRKR
jgi:cyclopropane-fatty-acyl-phospholipid synthase